MSEIPQLPGHPVDAARPTASANPALEPAWTGPGVPAFEALLERLEVRAAELELKSKSLSGPAELPGALDTARVSLEEALHLGEELLEAYRAAQRASEPQP